MTTLIPLAPYTSDELRQHYPQQLALQQVQVLMRHGERSPVSARFENAGLPKYWPYCNAAQQLRSVIMASNASWDELKYRRKLETFNGTDDSTVLATGPKQETHGICLPGELTDTGRGTTLALGTRLRRLYIDQLNFMPVTIENTDNFYLRATPIPRALESVQQAFHGMYPPSSRMPGMNPPTIVTRQASDETLFPNEGGCRRFAELSQAFAKRTSERWNDSSDLAYLTNLIGKWMPKDSKAVKVDGHPRLSGLLDTMNSTLAHGKETKLPKEFYDTKGLAITDKICVEEWFSGYVESKEYRSLGIGALVGDVTARMVERARLHSGDAGKGELNDVKFALSGCHDTTLAAVLASVGAFQGEKWPPYTSHVAFELFNTNATAPSAVTPTQKPSSSWWSSIFGTPKDILTPTVSLRTQIDELSESEKQKFDGWYVRLRYNDRIMTIPGCKAAGKHFGEDESLCTLEAFKSVVDKFTPKNWKNACATHLGEDAFPKTAEPAGI